MDHKFTKEMEAIIVGLCEDQQVSKELTDDIESRRKDVKRYLNDNKLSGSFQIGDVRLSYSESTRSTTDEDMIIEIIKEQLNKDDIDDATRAALTRCIVKKEVVDEAALSNALYGSFITTELLEPAVSSSTTNVLKITRKVLKE